jgi:nicotinate phosphoribosyltransferase
VHRRHDAAGRMAGDTLTLAGEPTAGDALLQPVMRAGRRLEGSRPLAAVRRTAAESLERLPDGLRDPEVRGAYPVDIAPCLEQLAAEVDAFERAAAGA